MAKKRSKDSQTDQAAASKAHGRERKAGKDPKEIESTTEAETGEDAERPGPAIAAIGASAVGLEGISQLLEAVPT